MTFITLRVLDNMSINKVGLGLLDISARSPSEILNFMRDMKEPDGFPKHSGIPDHIRTGSTYSRSHLNYSDLLLIILLGPAIGYLIVILAVFSYCTLNFYYLLSSSSCSNIVSLPQSSTHSLDEVH